MDPGLSPFVVVNRNMAESVASATSGSITCTRVAVVVDEVKVGTRALSVADEIFVAEDDFADNVGDGDVVSCLIEVRVTGTLWRTLLLSAGHPVQLEVPPVPSHRPSPGQVPPPVWTCERRVEGSILTVVGDFVRVSGDFGSFIDVRGE